MKKGWIGVDLDGTLAEWHGWGDGNIGEVIEPMRKRVMGWDKEGREVRIFTGRAGEDKEVIKIGKWLEDNGFPDFSVTNVKDHYMEEFWDDRAVAVERNTGRVISERKNFKKRR